MPQLQHFDPNSSVDELRRALDVDGALIVDGLSQPIMEKVKEELSPYIEATRVGGDDFSGRFTTRTGALVARSPASRDLVLDPLINGVVKDFLSPYCFRYQLHLTQVIRIKPGQTAQVLHRDRSAWGDFLPRSIEPQLNTIWAMTNFTFENGATQVVPGSHKWDDSREAKPEETCYAEMKAGSVLIYTGSVIHSGGANVSQEDRIGINITYTLGWLRQEENQYLSCPPIIAKDLPEDLRALLGYTLGSYALGYFSPPVGPGKGPESVDPSALFEDSGASWGENWNDDLYAKLRDKQKMILSH